MVPQHMTDLFFIRRSNPFTHSASRSEQTAGMCGTRYRRSQYPLNILRGKQLTQSSDEHGISLEALLSARRLRVRSCGAVPLKAPFSLPSEADNHY
jgi:hypothetical protein